MKSVCGQLSDSLCRRRLPVTTAFNMPVHHLHYQHSHHLLLLQSSTSISTLICSTNHTLHDCLKFAHLLAVFLGFLMLIGFCFCNIFHQFLQRVRTARNGDRCYSHELSVCRPSVRLSVRHFPVFCDE